MKIKLPKHNMDGVFILLLFAVFAIAVVSVLALGATSYKNLVKRDDDAYNRRIITSYVTAKIRNYDDRGAVAVGGFTSPDKADGIETLHLYRMIDEERFDFRIYYYKGYIYELFTTADNVIEPLAGNAIMEAQGLSFEQTGSLIRITAVDSGGREGTAAVAIRSRGEVAP